MNEDLTEEERKRLEKLADSLVEIRAKLGSTFTTEELIAACGLEPISQSIDYIQEVNNNEND